MAILFVCVSVQALCDSACLPAASCDFQTKTFAPNLLLHIPCSDEDECHHLEPGVKLSCCKAPAQPSNPLISSGRGQEVRQGRGSARQPSGAQGPTHRPSCRAHAATLLAHSLLPGAGAGRTLWSSAAPTRILHTLRYTNTH